MRAPLAIASILLLALPLATAVEGSPWFRFEARQVEANAPIYCHILVACAPTPRVEERVFVVDLPDALCGGFTESAHGYGMTVSSRGRGTSVCATMEDHATSLRVLSRFGSETNVWVSDEGAQFGACEGGSREVRGPFVAYGSFMGTQVGLYGLGEGRLPCP